MTTGAPHSDEEMRAFENSQNALTGTLSRLMVVVEKYPDLKANENFLALQSQLEGTENRITVERQRYNEIVREYNTKIRSFPTNVVAGFFTFERRALFTAKPGSDVVPEVKF
jgi:LemA protein